MKKEFKKHITMTEGICGGKPCIAGHRIRVQDIVILHFYQGMDSYEIASQYPGITLADIYAALAYYYDNMEEINQAIQEEEEFYREMKAKTPSRVQQKLREQNAQNYSISS